MYANRHKTSKPDTLLFGITDNKRTNMDINEHFKMYLQKEFEIH